MKKNTPIAMADIWDRWGTENKAIESCCVITMPANQSVSSIHERMPVIITPENHDAWLDNSLQNVVKIKQIMKRPVAADLFESYSVSVSVNKDIYDNANCTTPLP